MRKFKLIKEYPGSPKLNTVVMVHGECVNYEKIVTSLDGLPSYKSLINSPEYWEEIKEKEYEILSFQGINDSIIYNKENTGTDWYKYFNNEHKNILKIHSVKRLSDGEIFTIGDKVFYKWGINNEKGSNFVIDKFKLSDNEIEIICNFTTKCYLKDLFKVKTPLFTTEDGVEIFEGEKCWFINSDKIENHSYEVWRGNGDGKYFSTKEAAQKFIDKNKKIKIGDYEVEFPGLNRIIVNNVPYHLTDLREIVTLMSKGQIKSLNVGCSGQYKVDLDLINKIIVKLQSM
jgi:hypothetical protein